MIPAVCNVVWGFLCFGLSPDPEESGIITDEARMKMEVESKRKMERGDTTIIDDDVKSPISFSEALRIPMVAQVKSASSQ